MRSIPTLDHPTLDRPLMVDPSTCNNQTPSSIWLVAFATSIDDVG